MPNRDESEITLLTALKAGSHSAFECLYHRYKRLIYYNLNRLVHQHEMAEELTHDVFLKVWQLRDTIDTSKSFEGFIRRIAGNLAIDFYRRAALDKRMRETLIQTATIFDDPLGEDMDRAENASIIKSILEKLPPRRREIFSLCKLEGRRYTEVAEMLGIGEGTVNDHIVKATKFIRSELAKHPDGYVALLLMTIYIL